LKLLDTDVLIDVARGYLPAVRWFSTLVIDEVGVPGPVALEVIKGCRNRREVDRVQRILNRLPIYWPSANDGDRALESFADHHLAHNLGILDALIAECAVGAGATLVTFNVKHFRVIADLSTEQPYQR
jgi:predicted nucleic acid-binding protein